MPFPTKKLKVFPNPWLYIDHLGRPAGRVPADGYEDSPSAGPVGARLTDVSVVVAANVMRVAGQDIEAVPAIHDHRWTYSKDAVSIPNSGYYRDAVKRGDLVAADKETASLCGLKFEDPSAVLAKAKSAAVTAFDAETDPDAYKRFGAVEPLYTEPVTVATTIPVLPAQTADKASK